MLSGVHYGQVLTRDGTWRRPKARPACPPHNWSLKTRTLIDGHWTEQTIGCSRCGKTATS